MRAAGLDQGVRDLGEAAPDRRPGLQLSSFTDPVPARILGPAGSRVIASGCAID
jgi:hypothetical protein